MIARIAGFSSLIIQTAGYSGTYGAEGVIPALDPDKAEEIGEFILNKISRR